MRQHHYIAGCFELLGYQTILRPKYQPSRSYVVPVGPLQVTKYLQKREKDLFGPKALPWANITGGRTQGPIQRIFLNQVFSSPEEDRYTCAMVNLSRSDDISGPHPAMMLGIYDGHGGHYLADIVEDQLLQYVAAANLSPSLLRVMMEEFQNTKAKLIQEVSRSSPVTVDTISKLFPYQCRGDPQVQGNIGKALEHAFESLDENISRCLLEQRVPATNLAAIAVSGCVATVAIVTRGEIHCGFVGDAEAYIGRRISGELYKAIPLTSEPHHAANISEKKRVLSEHPPYEKATILQEGRLLGYLEPLRSLGDFHYKWRREQIIQHLGYRILFKHYFTPPYLTATPEVTSYSLTTNDHFILMATDGLWEFITPQEAVQLVGSHLQGTQALRPLYIPDLEELDPTSQEYRMREQLQMDVINTILEDRKRAMMSQAADSNAATHVIRHALGDTGAGPDYRRIAKYLQLPNHLVRYYRDDITVLVAVIDPTFTIAH